MYIIIGLFVIISIAILYFGMTYVGPGSECQSHSDCPSGACARATYASGAPYKCCPNGKTKTIWFREYCTDLDNGLPCGSNDMCKSGDCNNGPSGFGLSGLCQKPCAYCPAGSRCQNLKGGSVRCVKYKTGEKSNVNKTDFRGCC